MVEYDEVDDGIDEPADDDAEQEDAKVLRLARRAADPYITEHEDGTTTLSLDHPLVKRTRKGKAVEEQEIAEVTFPPEARVEHLEASDNAKGEMAKVVHMLAALTGVPYATMRRMHTADFNRAAMIMNGLMGKKDPTTGGPS